MIIHDQIEQGTQAWLNLRRRRITASEVGAFAVAEPKCKLLKSEMQAHLDERNIDFKKADTNDILLAKCDPKFIAANTRHDQSVIDARSKLYAKKIAEGSKAELLEDYAMRVKGYMPEGMATQYGTDLEPEARRMYEFVTGVEVEQVAFVEHDNVLCGASPDGIIRNEFDPSKIDSGLEIKCHLPPTHALYILDPDAFEAEHRHQLHWQMAIMGCKYIDLWGYCPKMPYIKRRVWRSDYTERFVEAIDELIGEYQAAIEQYNAIYTEQRIERAKLMEERESLSA